MTGDATDPDLLETALTAVVRQVEGVADVFAPRNPVTDLPRVIGALISGDPERVNRVAVEQSDAAVDVTARIGVERRAATPETARDVADALLNAAPADRPVTIAVQVSRIS